MSLALTDLDPGSESDFRVSVDVLDSDELHVVVRDRSAAVFDTDIVLGQELVRIDSDSVVEREDERGIDFPVLVHVSDSEVSENDMRVNVSDIVCVLETLRDRS